MKQVNTIVTVLLVLEMSCSCYASNLSPEIEKLPTCDIKPGSVYDGDTLRVICEDEEQKIRFVCIDAPEIKQAGGVMSRDHLRSLLNQVDNQVKIEAITKDRYRRVVAKLWINHNGWQLLQLQQVKAGMVWANEPYKRDCPELDWEEIQKAEAEARKKGLGIWQGKPTPPWEWRKQQRER